MHKTYEIKNWMHDCIDLREFKKQWLNKIRSFKQKIEGDELDLQLQPVSDLE